MPAYVTRPATAVVPGPVSVKVVPLMVSGFMAVLKVALTTWLAGTPVAKLAGIVESTVGLVVFGTPVVNVQT